MDHLPHAVLGEPDKQSVPTEQSWEGYEGRQVFILKTVHVSYYH